MFDEIEKERLKRTETKRKRCYHRVISGLKRGGKVRFLTLTSSNAAPEDIQRSWRKLYMRCLRRGLIIGYIRVTEIADDGRKHLHILFRGSYIAQVWLQHQWEEIHSSYKVDIRMVKMNSNPRKVASYMAKYMSKETAGHYSWSWEWVWKGFARDWSLYKKYWWTHIYRNGYNTFQHCILGWDMWLSGKLAVDKENLALAVEGVAMPLRDIFNFPQKPSPVMP